MGIIKTKGIVVKSANSSDNDKILTILTADLGKIKVFCKGAKRTKGAFLNSTEFLAYSDLVLYEGNGELYRLNSAEPIEIFYNLRVDIDKLVYATLIAQIMCDVCQEEPSNKKIQLFLNTLYMISETDKNLDMILATFQIRLLGILGFIPRLLECVSCGIKNTEYYFSIKGNGVKCEVCSKLDKSAIKMSQTTYATILYILKIDAKKIFSYEVPEEIINELKIIANLYTTEKLEKEYKVKRY